MIIDSDNILNVKTLIYKNLKKKKTTYVLQ